MQLDDLTLFMYTVEEYKRFGKQLGKSSIISPYTDSLYVEVNTKLMLLRKYGCSKESVYIIKIIESMKQKYPEHLERLSELLKEYNDIETQNFEYILADGTKRNLYETIEDVMYGVYLHADVNRIKSLINTDTDLRFACVRKYVEELESIVLKIYDYLKKLGEKVDKYQLNVATVISLGDTLNNKQEINNSPFWKNLYGVDGKKENVFGILENSNNEDFGILMKCTLFCFMLEAKQTSGILENLVHPDFKKFHKDYSKMKEIYKSINNPGMDLRVYYNEEHTMAYIKILPYVDEPFYIRGQQVVNSIYEISLIKYEDDWKICDFGAHKDSLGMFE